MEKALTVKDKFNTLHSSLAKMEAELVKTIPKHIDPKKAIRVLLTSVRKNPKLLDCTPESVMGCLMEASTLGLMLDGVTGEAYPIPYKNQCQLIAGYKGLMKLAYQSDRVLSITSRTVHEKDKYEIVQGIDERITHIPSNDADPGEPVAFYAVAKLKGGGVKTEWMWKAEVDRIRNAAPGKNSDAWINHYDEMGKKTVVRRICKTLPASPELQTLISLDEMHDAGIAQNLAASAGFIVEGDEDRYQPEKGAINIGDLKATGGAVPPTSNAPSGAGAETPASILTKIYGQKVITADDFEAACIASGLPVDVTEGDDVSALAVGGDYKGAVKMLIAKMAEVKS